MKLTISGDNFLRVYSTEETEGTERIVYTEESIMKLYRQALDLKNEGLTIKLGKSK